MTNQQTIKDIVNQRFDPISQKINNIQYITDMNNTNACKRWSILKAIREVVGRQYSNLMMSIPLKNVIVELKSIGMTYNSITKELLNLRENGFIEMEVGTPIGIWDDEELKKYTVSSSKNRFAHIKLTHKGFESIR